MASKAHGAGRPATVKRRRLRRRLSAAVLLLIGLGVAGGLAATLTPTPQVAVADESASAMLRTGKELFDTSCVTCHGVNLQGVADRGPSLIGVGESAVYFQVSTGRMPAMRGEAQAPQKPRQFDEAQTDALGAYIQANGGGPVVPRDENGHIASQSLIGNDVARGGDKTPHEVGSQDPGTGTGEIDHVDERRPLLGEPPGEDLGIAGLDRDGIESSPLEPNGIVAQNVDGRDHHERSAGRRLLGVLPPSSHRVSMLTRHGRRPVPVYFDA